MPMKSPVLHLALVQSDRGATSITDFSKFCLETAGAKWPFFTKRKIKFWESFEILVKKINLTKKLNFGQKLKFC